MIDRSPRLLIVRLGALGDVVHAMPAAAALRRRYPEARIDWLVNPRYVELVRLVTAVDGAIPVDPRGRRRDLVGTIRELRHTHYDTVIDLQGLLKSAVLARASNARRVIGYPRAHLREPVARAFYSEAPDPGAAPHVVHRNLALLRAVGVEAAAVEFSLRVPRTAVAEAVAARMGGSAYVLVNPGAAWPNKRWAPERFGALARAIRVRMGWPSLVVWGPGEADLAAAVVAASDGAAELLPATDLVDLAGLAAGARLMVAGDTGPLHVAGAMGTPLVAIFGPTRPERNGPWSAADITVSRLDRCACHYERRCRLAVPCIDDIAVDEVFHAVAQRVGANGSR